MMPPRPTRSSTNGDRSGSLQNQGRGRWSPVLPKRFYHSSKQQALVYFTRYVRKKQKKNTHTHIRNLLT
jgi:hypothetical protein